MKKGWQCSLPLIDQKEQAYIMVALINNIDNVVIINEDTLLESISRLRPDIWSRVAIVWLKARSDESWCKVMAGGMN